MRPALTAPARGGCEIGGRDGRMARSAAEQKNGLTAISAIVVSARKKSLVHLIRRAQVIPMLGREVVEASSAFAILDEAFDRPAVLGAVFAYAMIFHASLQEDAVGPHVDVPSRRQIALLPASVSPSAVSREITAGDRFGASLPSKAVSAS